MNKTKNNIWVFFLFIFIVVILGIFLFKHQEKTGSSDLQNRDAINVSNQKCESFNTGFKILSLNYTNSINQVKEKTVAVWYPTEESEKEYDYLRLKGSNALNGKISKCGKFPLVVFVHGFSGCGTQSIFLTEELARNGYIVIATDHDDASCSIKPGEGTFPSNFDLTKFRSPQTWSEKSFIDRKEDVEFLIDYINIENSEENSFFFNTTEINNIGIVGHSLGGYTSYALIGGWPSWKDKRIKAAVLLSPYLRPFILLNNTDEIEVPVMFQGGTLDEAVTPFIPEIYYPLKVPKYFLNIKFAGHLAWANVGCLTAQSASDCIFTNQRVGAINYYTISFLDKYLKNESDAEKRLKVKKEILESYDSNI